MNQKLKGLQKDRHDENMNINENISSDQLKDNHKSSNSSLRQNFSIDKGGFKKASVGQYPDNVPRK